MSWVDQTFPGESGLRRCPYVVTLSSKMCPLGRGIGHAPCFSTRGKNAVFPQSKEGKSPLHMAAIHGRFTRSQILIQNGMALGDFVTSSPSSENVPLEPPLPPPTSHAIPSQDGPRALEPGACGRGPAPPAQRPRTVAP